MNPVAGRVSRYHHRSMFIAFKRILSQLEVQPEGGNPHRAALLVVGRIRNVLEIEAGKKAWKKPRAIVRFPDILRTVFQPSVADQEIVTAELKILPVESRNPAGRKLRGDGIEGPMPPRARDRNAGGRQSINRREG